MTGPSHKRALAGVARSGATRAGHLSGRAFVTINGVDMTAANRIEKGSLSVTDERNAVPNTCTMRVEGVVPARGHEVIVKLGSRDRHKRMFAGQALIPATTYLNQTMIGAAFTATDYTNLLKGVLITGRYTATSASQIIRDLFAASPTGCVRSSDAIAGFFVTKVPFGLPVIDEITFTETPADAALDQIMGRVGGDWLVDYNRRIRIILDGESIEAPPRAINASHPTLSKFEYSENDAQRKTRCYVEGRGSKVLAAVAAGSTQIPLESVDMFEVASNVFAKVAPQGSHGSGQHLTFAGVSEGGSGAVVGSPLVPTSAPQFNNVSGAGSSSAGYYVWGITFITASGETTIGPRSDPNVHSIGGQSMGVTLPIGPAGTTSRGLYRCTAQAASGDTATATRFLVIVIGNNTDTSYQDGIADASLGAASPATNTSGLVDTAASVAAGSTSVPLVSTAAFSSTGGWAVCGSVPAFRYTGKTSSALTGVPASGSGSLEAALGYGSECVVAPVITGIPASGTGAITQDLQPGDELYVVVQVDDLTQQAALAALYTTATYTDDGIRSMWVQDRRLSITEAEARGEAELAKVSEGILGVAYTVQDPSSTSGQLAVVNLDLPAGNASINVTGSFAIQRVTIRDVAVRCDEEDIDNPTYEVEASNDKFSLEELIRQRRGVI